MSTLKVNNIGPFSGTTITMNPVSATGSFTGSFDGTIANAISASFASSGDGTFSGSFSGSYEGDGSGLTGVSAESFPFTGDAVITGSLLVTGSRLVVTEPLSGSFGKLSNAKNVASSQWNTSIPSTTITNGTTQNLLELTSEESKSNAGTTSYDPYFIGYGRDLTLSGTSGTANISISGSNYAIGFDTDLEITANNFVAASQSILLEDTSIDVAVNSPSAGVLRFGSNNKTVADNLSISNTSGNLNGSFDTAVGNHIRIPYFGKPYEDERLQHYIRVNFNIESGNENFSVLQLRRFKNDSVIGSGIPIRRYNDPELLGQQHVFETYTSDPADSFVVGGFYIALENPNTSQDVSGSLGFLIQTNYDTPTIFD